MDTLTLNAVHDLLALYRQYLLDAQELGFIDDPQTTSLREKVARALGYANFRALSIRLWRTQHLFNIQIFYSHQQAGIYALTAQGADFFTHLTHIDEALSACREVVRVYATDAPFTNTKVLGGQARGNEYAAQYSEFIHILRRHYKPEFEAIIEELNRWGPAANIRRREVKVEDFVGVWWALAEPERLRDVGLARRSILAVEDYLGVRLMRLHNNQDHCVRTAVAHALWDHLHTIAENWQALKVLGHEKAFTHRNVENGHGNR